MSTSNEAVLRRILDAWSRRDFAEVADLTDPNLVVDLSRNVFNPDVYRGHRDIKRFADAIDETWEDFSQEVVEVIEVGERLVVKARISGRGRAGGVPAQMEVFGVWAFRNGKAQHVVGGLRDHTIALQMAAAERFPEPQARAAEA